MLLENKKANPNKLVVADLITLFDEGRQTWNCGSAAAVSIFAKFGSGIYCICIMDQYA